MREFFLLKKKKKLKILRNRYNHIREHVVIQFERKNHMGGEKKNKKNNVKKYCTTYTS